jgi:predicted RNA-binding protein with PIN domain
MSLIIDGYNLLYASGILGGGTGPRGLERSRQALLAFLAASIDPAEIPRTVVVFDAAMAPPGLPRTLEYAGISVRFAERTSTADELIAELIQADHAPRRLTVVSSDHQVQRAARRRKATAVDSDKWCAEIRGSRLARLNRAADDWQSKPSGPFSPREIEFWVRQFQLEDSQPRPEDASQSSAKPSAESAKGAETDSPPGERGPFNPFPPGYAEDISEDDV